MEEMRKIEGSGYGCPLNAFFDGIFIFLQKYFVKIIYFFLSYRLAFKKRIRR